MNKTTFASLGLVETLVHNLEALGYREPSPIQAMAIPTLLEGRDLLGCAQTGTGKTAAFGLPLLDRLVREPKRLQRGTMRALILAPTRELAVQIAESIDRYGNGVRFRLATVYGGVSQRPQVNALSRGLDILVATPGRLLDLREQGHLSLDGVEHFVLDEADRMLDMGFMPDIERIVADLPSKRQTAFFSATFDPKVTKLARTLLTDPVSHTVRPEQPTADKVQHSVCFLQRTDKSELLNHWIEQTMQNNREGRVLVFTKTKLGAEKLAKRMGSAHRAESIHGDKSQAARQRALEQFRRGRSPVLVATDVAARGIDVRNVSLVINFDLPLDPESYIHRIGRTARAGAEGLAVSFCTAEDRPLLTQIERLLKQTVTVDSSHPWHIEVPVGNGKAAPKSGFRKGPRQGYRKSSGGGSRFRSFGNRDTKSGPRENSFKPKRHDQSETNSKGTQTRGESPSPAQSKRSKAAPLPFQKFRRSGRMNPGSFQGSGAGANRSRGAKRAKVAN